jgi:hypothetical protein
MAARRRHRLRAAAARDRLRHRKLRAGGCAPPWPCPQGCGPIAAFEDDEVSLAALTLDASVTLHVEGGRVTARRLRLAGSDVQILAGRLTLEDVALTGANVEATGGELAGSECLFEEAGLQVSGPAEATLSVSALERGGEAPIRVEAGGRLVMTDVVVRAYDGVALRVSGFDSLAEAERLVLAGPRPLEELSAGVWVAGGGRATVHDLLGTGLRADALHVQDDGSVLDVGRAVLVGDDAVAAAPGARDGRSVVAADGASLTLRDVRVSRAAGTAVHVQNEGTHLDAARVSLAGSGEAGVGLAVVNDAAVSVCDLVGFGSRWGVLVERASLDGERVVTRGRDAGAVGMFALLGDVDLRHVELSDRGNIGLDVAGAEAVLRLAFARSNGIGLLVRDHGHLEVEGFAVEDGASADVSVQSGSDGSVRGAGVAKEEGAELTLDGVTVESGRRPAP